MKSVGYVCLIASAVIASAVTHAAAQVAALTEGISVRMAQTKNAVPYPDADDPQALVATITADSHLYLGVKSVTRDQLLEEMTSQARQHGVKLYIKADARATFSDLKMALGPARSAHFETAVLLTSQPAPRSAAGLVAPQGIQAKIAPNKAEGAIHVRLSGPGESSELLINQQVVPWRELEATLKDLVHNPDQLVKIEASDATPFADIARVMDDIRKAGASVSLPIYNSL